MAERHRTSQKATVNLTVEPAGTQPQQQAAASVSLERPASFALNVKGPHSPQVAQLLGRARQDLAHFKNGISQAMVEQVSVHAGPCWRLLHASEMTRTSTLGWPNTSTPPFCLVQVYCTGNYQGFRLQIISNQLYVVSRPAQSSCACRRLPLCCAGALLYAAGASHAAGCGLRPSDATATHIWRRLDAGR